MNRKANARFMRLAILILAGIATIAGCGSTASVTPGRYAPTSMAPSMSSSASMTSTSSTPMASASTSTVIIGVTIINGVHVLTDGAGYVLYAYSPDTSKESNCVSHGCLSNWPPLLGSTVAGNGIENTLGTVTRSNGDKQVTYNGHPLYTFAGDMKPGEDNGNGSYAYGGYWAVVPVSGSPSFSKSSSGM